MKTLVPWLLLALVAGFFAGQTFQHRLERDREVQEILDRRSLDDCDPHTLE